MEYILIDTDIFDNNIEEKLRAKISANLDCYMKEYAYKFTASFHVNLLNDPRFEEFDIPSSKTSKGTKKDKIYDVMSFQLRKLEQVFSENDIEVCSTTIQGAQLDAENIIKIEIKEDHSEPYYTGREKNKRRMKVSSIIPSLPYTQELTTNLASERISKIYCDFMNIVKDRKIMSEILGIEATNDDKKIFKAFAEQYGELWLTTEKRERELREKLVERSLAVLNKYVEKDKEEGVE